MRRWAHPLALALTLAGALGTSGCQPEPMPATAIVVSVKTDLTLGVELTHVTYRVFAVGPEIDWDAPVSEFSAAAESLDQPFVIKKRNAQELVLSVEGASAPAEPPSVVYRVRARFVDGKTLALRVFLAKACLGRALCMFEGLTCYGEPRGAVRAGVCAAIPDDPLEEVTTPGDESSWEPMIGKPLDAGQTPGSGARQPASYGSYSAEGGLCSSARPTTAASCESPGTFDAGWQ